MTAPCEIWREFFYVSIPYQKKSTAKSTGVPNKGPENKIHDPLHGPFLGHANFTKKIHAKLHDRPPGKIHAPKSTPKKLHAKNPRQTSQQNPRQISRPQAPQRYAPRPNASRPQAQFLQKLELDVAMAPQRRSPTACNFQGLSAHL